MHYVAKRFGFRLSRGWVSLIVIIALLTGTAFWIGPFRARPPQLQLFALSGDGRFREFVGIPSAWADTLPAASEATARFPLILAVHNAGAQVARPTRLNLHLPARFRVTDAQGQPLPFQSTMGNPLVRYELPLSGRAIEPGHLPAILPGLDTLWLEPVVPSMYCTALSDSVPEFVSAPPINPQLLSRVRVFYSFSGERIRQRQTGLLTIQVDPELVKRDPAPNPPVFETQVIKPQAPRPELGSLRHVGERTSWCGDPGRPVELYDVVWETADGGRFIVLYHGGVPRKYLFDLNRDSIIELEMWDQDNDGKFESRRAARMAIPAFLMPYREAQLDSLAADSAAAMRFDTAAATPQWFDLFYDTAAGPLRFAPRDSSAAARTTQPQPSAPAARTPAHAPVTVPTNVPAPTPQFLELFNDVAAGPLRFYRAEKGLPQQRRPAPAPAPAPTRRDTGPRLLGVPVDSVRR